ncbi:MAG TPA: glycosyltransferase family 2 protein [Acidimicrobiales bacterium]|nr:glycosyltransferase family 2 protein [Acidimicrobiales bacterium]
MVVAYGPPGPLEHALGALEGRFPVTVVDNGSDAATEAAARRHGARYHHSGANLGFAAGVNVALGTIDLDTADVLLLNPDARITPDGLERLHDALAADSRLAAVGPAIAGAPTGWPWHTPLRPWAEAVGGARRTPGRTFLSGAVLLLRGRALAEVGPLDPRFFLYAEEEDWQRRALRQGWRVRHCPEVEAAHASGGTDRDIDRLLLRLHAATERYVRKWYGRTGWLVYRSGVIAGQLARTAVRRGWPRARAWRLARLYVAGPDRQARRAGAVPPPGQPA